MKNQYFGDINDYRKYGLLNAIQTGLETRLLVAWMLTPDDGSSDGSFVSYLSEPEKWEHYDPGLFWSLKHLLESGGSRKVEMIERSSLLGDTKFFSTTVPDRAVDRTKWFDLLMNSSAPNDFIFLDPDNGLEVKSRPYGSKNSSKYLYWREVESLWSSEKSLLIYQHFAREKRIRFIQRMLTSLSVSTPGSLVEAFSTPHVVFLMALQPNHQLHRSTILESVQKRWNGQIKHWGATCVQKVN